MKNKVNFDEFHLLEDEQLLELIHDKNDYALDFLMRKYKLLVEKNPNPIF